MIKKYNMILNESPLIQIFNMDCMKYLKECPDNYFHSCVTDPPYGISFMNKKWDYDVPSVKIWKEVLRVLRPGAYILCACGTRTQHRMTCNIEDAGFEIRDVISWIYGQGFPKSLNIANAISKRDGAARDGAATQGNTFDMKSKYNEYILTERGKQWEGWGTTLKPATEFWTLARKPLSEKTVTENVLKWGVGGINIDACRIGNEQIKTCAKQKGDSFTSQGFNGCEENNHTGRFPTNVIFDEEAAKLLDEQSGNLISGKMDCINKGKNHGIFGKYNGHHVMSKGDSGGASRFFYIPKVSTSERNKGLEKIYSLKENTPLEIIEEINKYLHNSI